MQDPTDPELLTPDERLAELGLILATGYLRHRAARRVAVGPSAPPEAHPAAQESNRSRENELDGPGDQSVHVRHAEGS